MLNPKPCPLCGISIHAPRTGSDKRIDAAFFCVTVFQSTLPARGATSSTMEKSATEKYFNPRSPHGERHDLHAVLSGRKRFQSTLPARGATFFRVSVWDKQAISIHAPRTGSDRRQRKKQG